MLIVPVGIKCHDLARWTHDDVRVILSSDFLLFPIYGPALCCQHFLCCILHNRSIQMTVVHVSKVCGSSTGGPSSLHERGRDSCLRAVLCYKRLFTKACMGCKRFFLKERKNVMFLNKIDVPYCLVVFFVVCPRLRPF